MEAKAGIQSALELPHSVSGEAAGRQQQQATLKKTSASLHDAELPDPGVAFASYKGTELTI